ncbi:MAG TPA: hypothetical protein ENH52_11840 [Nitrospirae bacterium]|nr:hypothetical protein [Nitrospirota bacterium]
MLTIKLPGISKTELYRGLSCVPGNLLAQFLGGDGGVSLPTYPVHINKMQPIIVTTIITVLGGVIWFAIKYPDTYKGMKMPSHIFIIGLVLFLPLSFWNLSAHTIYDRLIQHIDADKINAAKQSLGLAIFKWEGIIFFLRIFIACWLVSLGILKLSQFVKKTEHDKNKPTD